jgi:hypothetical protein
MNFFFFSDVWLDHPDTLRGLRKVFDNCVENDFIPKVLVMCGNFSSRGIAQGSSRDVQHYQGALFFLYFSLRGSFAQAQARRRLRRACGPHRVVPSHHAHHALCLRPGPDRPRGQRSPPAPPAARERDGPPAYQTATRAHGEQPVSHQVLRAGDRRVSRGHDGTHAAEPRRRQAGCAQRRSEAICACGPCLYVYYFGHGPDFASSLCSRSSTRAI